MNTTKIICRPEYYEVSTRMIYGKIHAVSGQFVFPDIDWSDNIFPIISWWIGAIGKYTSGKRKTIQLQFMEGPLAMRISRSGTEGKTIIKFKRNGKVVFKTTIEIPEFIADFRNSINSMSDYCEKIPEITCAFLLSLINRLDLAVEELAHKREG